MVAETDLYSMTAAQQARFRASHIGFVFQLFHLVPYLNGLDNIRMGATCGLIDNRRITELVEQLGLSHRTGHKPAELSVGECQRIALARALISDPKIILADEPTGNLDPDNSTGVLESLSRFADSGGIVLMVTHNPDNARYASRCLHMNEGKLS